MKSEIEKRFDEVADQYFDAFEEPYPLMITDSRPLSEHIRIMQECIKNGQPCPETVYENGADY